MSGFLKNFFNKKRIIIILSFVILTLLTLPFWAIDSHIKLIYSEDDIRVIDTKFYETVNLPRPKQEHYVFEGWFDGDKQVKVVSKLLGNDELVAKFHPRAYYIKYDLSNVGDVDISQAPQLYTYSVRKELPVLEKENYDFCGYKVNNGVVRSDIPAGTYGTVILEPVFTPKTYKINYVLNDGKLSNPIDSYTYGEGFKVPNPVKDGYNFAGWYLDKDFKNKLNITDNLSGDLTLYALFVKPTASRNLAKPYVVCGSYSASLQTGHPDNATVNAIIDGPGAWHEYISGKEYIADHNYHGASAFLYNNYLTIVREDGTEENYVKVSTSSILWTPGLSTDLLGTFSGELITQTCKGDDVVFNGWNKQ